MRREKFAIIGEVSARLPEGPRNRCPQVPWPQIVGFRNTLVHGYSGIDWAEMWPAASNRYPVLREQAAGIFAEESGGASGDSGQ